MRALLLALPALVAFQDPETETGELGAAAMRRDLAVLESDVRSSWSYWEDRTTSGLVDPETWLDVARAETTAPRTRADFARTLRARIADLRDGHAGLRVPGVTEREHRLPFEVRETVDGPVVVERDVAAGAPAIGDLWLALEGRPVAERFADEHALAFGSTPSGRRHAAWQRMLRVERTTCRATFAAPAGDRREVELATRALGRPEGGGSAWSLARHDDEVALLRIRSFKVERWREWLGASNEEREGLLRATQGAIERLFHELAQHPPGALILDLRGNSGGTDSLGIHLAKHLIEGEFRYFLLSGKVDGRWTEPAGLTYCADEGMSPYRGRVVALIDEGCFSTTDNLLRCLDDLHPSFVTVGRPTGGGTGAPRIVSTLPASGAEITLCTQRVYGPAGRLTEGRGTRPDVAVEWTRADVLERRDPDLAAALRVVSAGR